MNSTRKKLSFFECIFSQRGMRTNPEKIKAVMDAKEPSSMADLRSFLGLCNLSSNFVANYSMITTPLTRGGLATFSQGCSVSPKGPVGRGL